jgi:site-specific recombinase XerD
MEQTIKKELETKYRSFLERNSYSKQTVSQYCKYLSVFLERHGSNVAKADKTLLKESICEYINILPIDMYRKMIIASLHTFYYYLHGEMFVNRLLSKEDIRKVEDEITKFNRYLENILMLSDGTIRSNCNTIRQFLCCVFKKNNKLAAEKINFDHIQYYQSLLKHIKPSSRGSLMTRIRTFFKYLEHEYGVSHPEVFRIPLSSPAWKLSGVPECISEPDVKRLLSSYDRTTNVGIRDYAIVRCCTDLALRCAEAANLSIGDFDWPEGVVTIQSTKSKTARKLPIPMRVGKAIERYLKEARPLTKQQTLFVRFRHEQGQPMGTSQIRETIRRAAMRAGLDSFHGPHTLRHKAARDMITNGISIKTIADILGHESVETTLIYTKVNISGMSRVSGEWPI